MCQMHFQLTVGLSGWNPVLSRGRLCAGKFWGTSPLERQGWPALPADKGHREAGGPSGGPSGSVASGTAPSPGLNHHPAGCKHQMLPPQRLAVPRDTIIPAHRCAVTWPRPASSHEGAEAGQEGPRSSRRLWAPGTPPWR